MKKITKHGALYIIRVYTFLNMEKHFKINDVINITKI